MRVFDTGATRDKDDDKYDYEGFLCPFVLEGFGEYMHRHRKQADGNMRDSDNWQKGMPISQYVKSLLRHVFSVWRGHRRGVINLEDAYAALFNIQGIIHEYLKRNQTELERGSAVNRCVTQPAEMLRYDSANAGPEGQIKEISKASSGSTFGYAPTRAY